MSKYQLSKRAVEDLESIFDFTWGKFGQAQAEKYLSELKAHAALIAENPKLAPERKEFTPPIRLFLSGSHVIAYLENDHGIFIVRFLHKAMDVGRHL